MTAYKSYDSLTNDSMTAQVGKSSNHNTGLNVGFEHEMQNQRQKCDVCTLLSNMGCFKFHKMFEHVKTECLANKTK